MYLNVLTTVVPEFLPPLARQLLHRRMERHGDDMVRLVIAVTLLQRDKGAAVCI